MPDTTADAFPAKRFFVEMLTRDIELQDAILDLLDNCVDGAIRTNIGRDVNHEYPYRGFQADITLQGSSFLIRDNCGGIPLDLAENYAFRMGRVDRNRDVDIPTVGVYGIGMKRAVFKIGRMIEITSQIDAGDYFRVSISPEWLDNDHEWRLPMQMDRDVLESAGTEVTVTNLHAGISRLFADETDFINTLKKAISAYYGYIMQKGFVVTVNGDRIEPQQVSLLFDRAALARGNGILPYVYRAEVDGVSVVLTVGLYRDLPSDLEEDEALSGKSRPTSERAGWTVVCNDRVVLFADKSRVTGWGESGVPQYHTQFVSIAGVAEFRSNDASKLPVATTKRAIDGNSEVYLAIKDYMREGLKTFTDFTNKWKRPSEERDDLKDRASLVTSHDIPEMLPPDRYTAVRREPGAMRFRPSLPLPREDDPVRQVRFSRKVSQIAKVAEYLFDDTTVAPSEVGAKCFDDVLAKVTQ